VKQFKIIFVICSLLLAFIPSVARADVVSNCRIGASQWNIVSLGFPLKAERLANKRNPKILVLPFQLKGETKYILTAEDKNKFLESAKSIDQLSQGKSEVTFVFNDTLELAISAADLDVIKRNVSATWQKDFDNSTYGFVTKTLLAADSKIDYKGIDAVILFGSSVERKESIAEAMMFTNDSSIKFNPKKTPAGNWWDPIKTNEGEISNTVLIYNALDADTITHEMLHLYGLQDLYGSPSSPRYSAMASGGLVPATLLSYEKWVLGWLPDSNVICVNPKKEISSNPVNNRFVLDYSSSGKSLILPTGATTALVVDIVNFQQSPWLQFYSLDNDARPPIKIFSPGVRLSDYQGVSTQFQSTDFTLLISDNDGSSVVINLIPSNSINSVESKELIKQAGSKKIELDGNRKAKEQAQVAAELKTREEARVAAELKAKQDADAKAAAEKIAAELKAKQEADKKAAAAKAAALKKTTITCIKGKASRKVTAVKPVCPTGYKVKK
jgi:hypothetical protein